MNAEAFKSLMDLGFSVAAVAIGGVFIVILLVGYVYAWKKGALEWE